MTRAFIGVCFMTIFSIVVFHACHDSIGGRQDGGLSDLQVELDMLNAQLLKLEAAERLERTRSEADQAKLILAHQQGQERVLTARAMGPTISPAMTWLTVIGFFSMAAVIMYVAIRSDIRKEREYAMLKQLQRGIPQQPAGQRFIVNHPMES